MQGRAQIVSEHLPQARNFCQSTFQTRNWRGLINSGIMRDALTPMMQQYRRLRGSIPRTRSCFSASVIYELFLKTQRKPRCC